MTKKILIMVVINLLLIGNLVFADDNAECNRLLLQAARSENMNDIRLHLSHGWKNINTKDPSTGETPLIIAVKKKNMQIIELLLDEGCNVNSEDNNGYTAVMHCITENLTMGLRTLLEKRPGATSIDYKAGMTQNTPLHMAAESDNTVMAEILLGYYPSTLIMNVAKKTAFMIAVERGNIELVSAFGSSPAFDVTRAPADSGAVPPLLWALRERKQVGLIQEMLRMPNAIYSVDRDGRGVDEYFNAFWTVENAAKTQLRRSIDQVKARADFGF
jgi:ankyrin repeat protein